MTELKDKLDNLEKEYSYDAILSEIGFPIIASYIKRNRYVDWYELVGNNDDAVRLVKALVEFLRPRGYLTKEEVKKEISDFIDFWYI